MKKPVGRLLYPNTGWYFAAMLLFTAAAAAVGQYILAGGALFVTLIMFIISRARLSRRKRQLMSYVQTATDSVGISVHAGSAFPMAVIRLPENEIIWGNPSFFTITGLSDTACYQTLDAVVPGFSTSWLREGRSELPGDQIIGGRRYRIYGNYVKSEDDATTVQLATIYFADMTEMFNVRDEFLRTRPIVSIILIDNYDELTANLSDSAISTLDAQLNDVVANWTAGLEALCRKIERNRYLLIFESKDLARLQDGRFSILRMCGTSRPPAACPRRSRSASARTAGASRRLTASRPSPSRCPFPAAATRPSSRTGSTSPSTEAAPKKRSGIRASNPA
ncbi:MAG: hypothetical protein ACLUFI_01415 [Oscillospiraceae bacterium]